MNAVTIYALAHPKLPDVIRYIGKTGLPLSGRLKYHLYDLKPHRPKCHRRSWLRSLVNSGIRPIIWPLEICQESEWQNREKYWISFFKPLGMLTNTTPGGEGGLLWREGRQRPRRTLESRERMRQMMTGRKITWDTSSPLNRKITSERNRRGWTPQMREKIIAANLGKKRTPEQQLAWKSSENFKITLKRLAESNARKKKPVIAEESGLEFESVKAAVRALGCYESGFREAMKKGWRCRGVHWKFKESESKI